MIYFLRCGHVGTNNYLKHYLDMIGQFIYNAIHQSALTFANMPTLRGANTELSDASTSGATVSYKIRLNQAHGFQCH